MKLRRIALWIVKAALVLGVLGAVLLALLMNRGKAEYRAFERAHADAPRRVAELTRRVSGMSRDRKSAERRPKAANAATTRTTLAAEFEAIHRLYNSSIGVDYPGRDYAYQVRHWLDAGDGGMALLLPAGDFPEEGTSGTLRGGAALRKRIRTEASTVLKNNRWHPPRGEKPVTTATLAKHLAPVLDRTEQCLNTDCVSPAPVDYGRLYYWVFQQMAPLTILRAQMHGRPDEAGRLLQNTLQTYLTLRLGSFPRIGIQFGNLWKILLAAAEHGGPLNDADLAKADRLLKSARLNEAQLADLRAAHVMNLRRYFGPESTMETNMSGGHPAWMALVETSFENGAAAFMTAQMRPVALAWAGGDEVAFERAVKQSVYMVLDTNMMITPVAFPPSLSSFAQEGVANDDVDFMRLILAAVRYRQAEGSYPDNLGDLIPRYLESSFQNGKTSFWAVDRAGEGQPGAKDAPRPIFYRARRLTATPQRCLWAIRRSYDMDDAEFINRTGMMKWFNGHSGMSQLYRELYSSKRVPAIEVRAYWPRDERFQRAWLQLLKEK